MNLSHWVGNYEQIFEMQEPYVTVDVEDDALWPFEVDHCVNDTAPDLPVASRLQRGSNEGSSMPDSGKDAPDTVSQRRIAINQFFSRLMEVGWEHTLNLQP